jgi:shikimate dehydrogenase
MAYLDHIDDAALAIGAVNTIVIDRSEERPVLTGHNTDWSGFSADLAANNIIVAGRDCIVLGAGGSARAVAYALAQSGTNVHLFSRRLEQARDLVTALQPWCAEAQLTAHSSAELQGSAFTAPLIVNTTPVGMTPHTECSAWPTAHPLPPGCVVYDLVYNPRETRLMQQAQAAGCDAHNGIGMLLRQGAQAFALWTGRQPDLAVMAAALT